MKSRFTLKATAALALCLSLPLAARAGDKQRGYPPGPCHQNARLCLQQMNTQVGRLRAYVRRHKPGEAFTFNPQPDPPGIPPLYRQANEAYRSLLAEFADLSDNAEIAGLNSAPSRAAIGDAQDKLRSLAGLPAGDSRAAASQALDALAGSVHRLQNDLDNGRRAGRRSKKCTDCPTGPTPKRS
jgi:hypothetical protein